MSLSEEASPKSMRVNTSIEKVTNPGVSSFKVMENEVKLCLVTLGGGLVLLHRNEAFMRDH